jgi:pSer/pThr/pTyr-binding forkhead associated (FHA) protein
MWILKAIAPEPEGVTFRISAGAVKTVGRSSGAEFFVDAALVSRLHCQLTAGRDFLEVKDLESTNGTFVNGKRVQTAVLRDGDTLSVGRIDLVVTRKAN